RRGRDGPLWIRRGGRPSGAPLPRHRVGGATTSARGARGGRGRSPLSRSRGSVTNDPARTAMRLTALHVAFLGRAGSACAAVSGAQRVRLRLAIVSLGLVVALPSFAGAAGGSSEQRCLTRAGAPAASSEAIVLRLRSLIEAGDRASLQT